MVEIGQRIRHARIQARIKQENLAAQSGISRSALVKLEKGDGGVRLMTLVAVFRSLGLLAGFESVLPSVSPSPNELAELERYHKTAHKRVRDAVKPRKTMRAWGDGTVIER